MKNKNDKANKQLITDADLAELLSVSPAWIRKQRRLRNKGEKHVFTIDPLYVGHSPRYQASQVNQWLEELAASKKA